MVFGHSLILSSTHFLLTLKIGIAPLLLIRNNILGVFIAERDEIYVVS